MREQRRGVTQYDRALGLEYGFEQAWRDADGGSGKGNRGSNFFTTPSTAAWSGEDAVPALVFNAARADTGVTYAVAPFRLDDVPFLDFRAKVLGYEAPRADVRISTGVGLSSRVPFITGPGMIRVAGRKWLERDDSKFETIGLVDGAYVENSGTATLGELLREIHNGVVRRGNRKVKIIVVAIQDLSAFTYSHSGIESQPGDKRELLPEDLRDLVERKDFERPIRFGFAEFAAPLAALNASRAARSFYTLNSLVETIATLRCAQGIADAKDSRLCAASQRSRSGEIIERRGDRPRPVRVHGKQPAAAARLAAIEPEPPTDREAHLGRHASELALPEAERDSHRREQARGDERRRHRRAEIAGRGHRRLRRPVALRLRPRSCARRPGWLAGLVSDPPGLTPWLQRWFVYGARPRRV